MSRHSAFLIFNFLGLQITWAACAFGAIQSMPLTGVFVATIYLLLHFLLSPSRNIDIFTMLLLSVTGIAIDYINMRLGVISFNNGSNQQFIPLWLVFLWCVFSLMIPHSIYWLRNKTLLIILFGGIGGSSSYWLGHKLGAIHLSEPLIYSVGIYFFQWAVYLPFAFAMLRAVKNTTRSGALSDPKNH